MHARLSLAPPPPPPGKWSDRTADYSTAALFQFVIENLPYNWTLYSYQANSVVTKVKFKLEQALKARGGAERALLFL
jgi:hypothetical protein